MITEDWRADLTEETREKMKDFHRTDIPHEELVRLRNQIEESCITAHLARKGSRCVFKAADGTEAVFINGKVILKVDGKTYTGAIEEKEENE